MRQKWVNDDLLHKTEDLKETVEIDKILRELDHLQLLIKIFGKNQKI